MDTFYHTRKFIQSILLDPGLLLIVAILFGTIRASIAKRPPARWVLAASFAFVTPLVIPIANLMTAPLEERFPKLDPDDVRDADVIVVLGGCIRASQSQFFDEPSLTEAAERITTGVKLAHLFPKQKLLFTSHPLETRWAGLLIRDLAVDPYRVILDGSAWTTVGNAHGVAARVDPEATSIVLVTSARHMPRAVGTFRQLGFRDLRPYPTDFQAPFRSKTNLWGHWTRISGALHEWAGLLIYWLNDETSDFFPIPL